MGTFRKVIILPVLVLVVLSGCSGNGDPVSGQVTSPGKVVWENTLIQNHPPHYSWGLYNISIDPDMLTGRVELIRTAQDHMNVTQLLENCVCSDCIEVVSIDGTSHDSYLVDIKIRHPFNNPTYTGFDVRGIVMFDASHEFPIHALSLPDRSLGDGELLNAEGYVTLYNSSTAGNGMEGYLPGNLSSGNPPNGLLNGFRMHVSDDPANTRNALYAGDSVTRTYDIAFPDGKWNFGYAIDACWYEPLNEPVLNPMEDFPISANCPEPWLLDARDITLLPESFSKGLLINLQDRSGHESHNLPLVECPELFDGTITASNVYYSGIRFEVLIENDKNAPPGDYKLLISCTDKENENSPAWMNLAIYQTVTITVEDNINVTEVTPDGLDFGGYDVSIEGDYAYVAAGGIGFYIVDISDPQNMHVVNTVDTNRFSSTIDVHNGHAFLMKDTVRIYDIDPPESVHYVKQIPIETGAPTELVFEDGYAYAAAPNKHFEIFDIDPIESTSLINTVLTDIINLECDVDNGYAYVTASKSSTHNLYIYDVSDPLNATLVNTVEFDYQSRYIDVEDGYAYMTNALNGLLIVDVDPPEEAHTVNMVWTGPNPSAIRYSNGYALVGTLYSDIWVIDVDPISSAHTVSRLNVSGGTEAIEIVGNYAYIVDSSGNLLSYNMIDPTNPTLVDALYSSCIKPRELEISNGNAYINSSSGGVQVVDISNPASAHTTGFLNTWHNVSDMEFLDGYGYFLSNDYGLQIIDIDPLESWNIVSEVPFDRKTYDLLIKDGYAYATSRLSGEDSYADLMVIDIDPPESAHLDFIWTDTKAHYPLSLMANDDYLFMYTRNDDTEERYLNTFYLTEPGNPVLIDESQPMPPTVSLYFADDRFYVIDANTLHVCNFIPPSGFEYIGSSLINELVYMYCTASSGNLLSLSGGSSGYYLIDVQQPDSPLPVFYDGLAHTSDIQFDDGYMYTCDLNSHGLRIFRID